MLQRKANKSAEQYLTEPYARVLIPNEDGTDVEDQYRKRIRIESSFNNKFDKEYTGLIWTYKLLNLEMIT